MIYQLLFCFATLVFDVLWAIRIAPDEKDLQIALLCQQLRILERKYRTKSRLPRPEKLILVTLVSHLKTQTQQVHERLSESVLLVQPDTRTPVRAPKANAVAERWVRTVRQECLDHLRILNQRHLIRVLKEYADYYNRARPHQGLAQQIPIPLSYSQQSAIHCRDVLGGILHNNNRHAA